MYLLPSSQPPRRLLLSTKVDWIDTLARRGIGLREDTWLIANYGRSGTWPGHAVDLVERVQRRFGLDSVYFAGDLSRDGLRSLKSIGRRFNRLDAVIDWASFRRPPSLDECLMPSAEPVSNDAIRDANRVVKLGWWAELLAAGKELHLEGISRLVGARNVSGDVFHVGDVSSEGTRVRDRALRWQEGETHETLLVAGAESETYHLQKWPRELDALVVPNHVDVEHPTLDCLLSPTYKRAVLVGNVPRLSLGSRGCAAELIAVDESWRWRRRAWRTVAARRV